MLNNFNFLNVSFPIYGFKSTCFILYLSNNANNFEYKSIWFAPSVFVYNYIIWFALRQGYFDCVNDDNNLCTIFHFRLWLFCRSWTRKPCKRNRLILRTGFEPMLHERKSCVLATRRAEHERGRTSEYPPCYNSFVISPGNYCNETIYNQYARLNDSRGSRTLNLPIDSRTD